MLVSPVIQPWTFRFAPFAYCNAAMNMYKYLLKSILSVLWGIYPEVELLGHIVILHLIF